MNHGNSTGGRIAAVSAISALMIASCTQGDDQAADEPTLLERIAISGGTTFVSVGESYASGEGSPMPFEFAGTELDVQLLNRAGSFDFSRNGDFADDGFGGYPRNYAGLSPDGQFITSTGLGELSGEPGQEPFSLVCHRSPYNGRALAFAALTRAAELYSGRFWDLACSGATIEEGLLGRQLTSHDYLPTVFVPAQLEIVDRLNLRNWVLIISVGGNDIGFGRVVADCLQGKTCADEELLNKVERGAVWEPSAVEKFLLDSSVTRTLPGLEGLPDAYRALADTIRDGTGIDDFWEAPKEVLITQYPSPIGAAQTGFCGDYDDGAQIILDDGMFKVMRKSSFAPGFTHAASQVHLASQTSSKLGTVPLAATENLSVAEAAKLYTRVFQPLNDAVAAAADEHGWTLVTLDEEYWATRSLCDGTRAHFNGIHASVVQQGDIAGAVHPNCVGHVEYANSLFPHMVNATGLENVNTGGRVYPDTPVYPNGPLLWENPDFEPVQTPCLPSPPARYGSFPTYSFANDYPAWGGAYLSQTNE